MPQQLINKEQAAVGMFLFLLLHSFGKNDVTAKRERKKISMGLKKNLKVKCSKEVKEKWNHISALSSRILLTANTDHPQKKAYVNPGIILRIFSQKWPELIFPFEIDNQLVESMIEAFDEPGLTLDSVRYTNNAVERLLKFVADADTYSCSVETIIPKFSIGEVADVNVEVCQDNNFKVQELNDIEAGVSIEGHVWEGEWRYLVTSIKTGEPVVCTISQSGLTTPYNFVDEELNKR